MGKQHHRLCNRMEAFLDEDDDQQCKRLLNDLKPTIEQAIEDSQFFAQAVPTLKAALANLPTESGQRMSLPASLESASAAAPASDKSENKEDEGFVKVSLNSE